MRSITGSALSRLRAWWPELLTVALLIVTGAAGQRDDPLFAMFTAIVGAIFWSMGWRHRRLPLHAKLDRMAGTVDEVHEMLLAADSDAAGGDGAPRLRLVP